MKRALITGLTGQDGSYLAEFLLQKNYQVFGLVRKKTEENFRNINHLLNNKYLKILHGDMTDLTSLIEAIKFSRPDEVYNLASQSFVPYSWEAPEYTSEVTGLGVLRILEAIRKVKKDTRIYQASSSEMFGDVEESPQNEETPFKPQSPYGVAKVFGHQCIQVYRNSYNIFAVSGIAFNHESERRGLEFVTRKISMGIAKIKLGLEKKITLGNINAKRDWGHAEDFVKAFWLMLQNQEPEDFVIATGKTWSIKDFLIKGFKLVNISNWEKYVEVDSKFFRPVDINILCGDYSKIKRKLGWSPKIDFDSLVKRMVEHDLYLLKASSKKR